MKKKEEVKEEVFNIGEYTLVNKEKLDRVINGVDGPKGRSTGLGKDAEPKLILAEYDKLGGLILKNGIKIAMGSFYDFKKRMPRETPEVEFAPKPSATLTINTDETDGPTEPKKKIKRVK